MNEKEIVLSILGPSPYQGAQIAYERCGYTLAENRVKHEFLPSALRPTEGDLNITVRELVDEEECKKISNLESSMCRYGSRVFTWPAILSREIQSGNFYIFEQDSMPVGCMKLAFKKSENDSTLTLSRTYFLSNDILPSLIELVSQQSSEVSKVEWACEPKIPIRNFFLNIHKIKSQYNGTMMMRFINFEGYCKSIGVPQDTNEEVIIRLNDAQCPWNEGIYRLNAIEGVLEVDRMNENSNADISLNPHQLSMVINGLTDSTTLHELGLISGSVKTAEKLGAIFPLDSFISYFRF